jgi:hypothetical protein
MNKKRPVLNKQISIKDFNDFYWLKVELVDFCRKIGCSSSGGKIEIANRIAEYLETGKVVKRTTSKKKKLPKSTHPITEDTIIGIDYRAYKEKTEFLKSHIGKNFHFTIHLLDYFNENTGIKTYRDLINEYHKEQKLRKDPNYVSKIAPQFEYNTYIRDFMKNNPDKTRSDAIKYWKIKKSKPGNNKYSKNDVI